MSGQEMTAPYSTLTSLAVPSPLCYAMLLAGCCSDLKLFQSLSTAVFYFYLYFTTVYAIRSRAVIPLACLSIGLTLAVLCNMAYPFSNKQPDSERAGSVGLEEEEEEGGLEDDDYAVEADVDPAHAVKRPLGRSRPE